MKKTLSWIFGAVILCGIGALVLMHPFHVVEPTGIAFAGLVDRALNFLILAGFLCLYRILAGPTAADRIVAIDILGILVVGLCGILTLATGQSWYLDIGIVWALQSFIGSLALAKHLEGRRLHD